MHFKNNSATLRSWLSSLERSTEVEKEEATQPGGYNDVTQLCMEEEEAEEDATQPDGQCC